MTKGRIKSSAKTAKGAKTTKNTLHAGTSVKAKIIDPVVPKHNFNISTQTKGQSQDSNEITIPGDYVLESAEDAVRYTDGFHANVSRCIKNGHKKPSSNGFYNNVKVDSKLVSSLVAEKPTLKILDPGVDLEELSPNFYNYIYPWNARDFAHDLSTNFSSPQLCKENQHVGTVDFISHWKNIKALLKSSYTNNHLSYLIHRVGDSVTIDHHDVLSTMLFPAFLELPAEFVDFTHQIIGKHMKAVKEEGKSNEVVLAKEAFSRILHRNMGSPMRLDLEASKKSELNFLHRFKISIKNMNFLVGTNIPVYSHSNDSDSVTVRGLDEKNTSFKPVEAFDLWLDNMVMNCSETHVTHHEQWKVKKTEWMKTDYLPKVGKFNPAMYLENGEKVLKFIKDNVKVGHSYWLYRAPNSSEITLYNISNIKLKKSETEILPIFVNWKNCDEPHLNVDILLNYISAIGEALKTKLPIEVKYEPQCVPPRVTKNNLDPTKTDSAESAEAANAITLNRVDSELHACFNKVKNKRLLQTNSNLVQDLAHVSVTTFRDTIKCIQAVYLIAIATSPNLGNYIHTKLVDKVFIVCSTLLFWIGPSTPMNKHLKFWEGTLSTRTWITEYSLGMSEILLNFVDWHSKVKDVKEDLQDEWSYLAFRAHSMNADVMVWVSRNVVGKALPPKINQDHPFTSNYHANILNTYDTALKQIPKRKSFSVSEKYIQSGSTSIEREELIGEVNWKIACAYLINAEFVLKYPSYVLDTEPPPCKKAYGYHFAQLPSTRSLFQPMHGVYRASKEFIQHSLEYLSKLQSTVGLHKIENDIIQERSRYLGNLLEEMHKNRLTVNSPDLCEKIRFCIDRTHALVHYDTVYITENYKVTVGGIYPLLKDQTGDDVENPSEHKKPFSYFAEATKYSDDGVDPPKNVQELQDYLKKGLGTVD